MRIIGLTGPSGAGKSLVCEHFKGLGIPSVNADEVYHGLLVPPSPCLDALTDAFGKDILTENGELSREKLSKIVFSDKDKLELLNKTVLGFVLDKIREIIKGLEADGEASVIIDAPTLIESGFHKECNTVVSVLCPAECRIDRIIARDSLKRKAAEARINAQKPDEFYISHSDEIIINDAGEAELIAKADALAKKLLL